MQMDARDLLQGVLPKSDCTAPSICQDGDRLQGVLPKLGRRLHSFIDLPTWDEWMNPSHHSVAIKGRTELIIICWASFEVPKLD
ncbi:hypothetical protein CEXT_151481 [Caerostris extrusa]|uniref:Uncharacterized protein n=1 Tax=Caerostris extrusa TaxID=172846 RepID=A0AAV4V772_CAEEX|nr:hypothetical protein CEXT_151481 [Caerostris extrusa]